jgi:hypothetical protein
MHACQLHALCVTQLADCIVAAATSCANFRWMLLLLLLPLVPAASSGRTPSCAGASGEPGAACSSSKPPV